MPDPSTSLEARDRTDAEQVKANSLASQALARAVHKVEELQATGVQLPPTVKYPTSAAQGKMLATNFVYHVPKDDQPARYEAIRGQCKCLAEFLIAYVPPSRELSLACTKLEEVCFWANAGIARNE